MTSTYLKKTCCCNHGFVGLRREKAAIAFTSQLYKRRRSRDAAADPNLFLNLSDNPGRRLSWSGSWGCLPTFRTNSTRFYNFTREQWMTPRDRLCALGFPVTPNTALAMGVPMLPVAWLDSLQSALLLFLFVLICLLIAPAGSQSDQSGPG